MSRIEELPDDFDEFIEKSAAEAAQADPLEDVEEYMRKTPLFMTDINNAGDESMSALLIRVGQHG